MLLCILAAGSLGFRIRERIDLLIDPLVVLSQVGGTLPVSI